MSLRSLCAGLALTAILAASGCSCGKCWRSSSYTSNAPPPCCGAAPAPCGPGGCPAPVPAAVPVQAYSAPAAPGCCGR